MRGWPICRGSPGHRVCQQAQQSGVSCTLLAHLQGEPSGRLLAYDPPTGTTRVLLDKIWAANGVALAQDGASVVVSSTNTACLLRYWLAGDKVGVEHKLCQQCCLLAAHLGEEPRVRACSWFDKLCGNAAC